EDEPWTRPASPEDEPGTRPTSPEPRPGLVHLLPLTEAEQRHVAHPVLSDRREEGWLHAQRHALVVRELAVVARGRVARAGVEHAEGAVEVLDDAAQEVHRAAGAALVEVFDLPAAAAGHEHAVDGHVARRVLRAVVVVVPDSHVAALRVDAQDVHGVQVVARGWADG